MFPPSTTFKTVHIEKNDPKIAYLYLDVAELSVSFTYSSFFASNLEIDDLIIKDGLLKITTTQTKSPDINWRELSVSNVFTDYENILKMNPLHLNIAKIENLDIQIDKSNFKIRSASLAPHHKNARLKLETSKMKIVLNTQKSNFLELDKLELLANVTKNQWRIDDLKIKKGLNEINLNTSFYNQNKLLQLAGECDFKLDSESLLLLYPNLPKELKSLKGQIHGSLRGKGELLNPDIESEFVFDHFQSDWINLEKITARIKKIKNIMVVDKIKAINQKEEYELLRPQSLFDLKKGSIITGRLSLALNNAFTNTFLYPIKDSLSNLKATLTGKVDVVWNGDKLFFEIKEKTQIKDFKLLSNSSQEILKNTGFGLDGTVLTLDKNLNIGVNAKLTMNNTLIKAVGEITDKGLNISIKDSRVNMHSLGPISGLSISGEGPTSAEIYGPFDNVKFDFIVDWNNFSLVDLNFGRVKSEFRFSLKPLQIDINKLSGIYNNSDFTAAGLLNFGDKSGMDLRIDFQNTNFKDAQKMYGLVFKNIKLPVTPDMNFSTSYRVQGGYGLDTLKIDGKINGTDLKVFDEEAERISLNFSLQNSILNFRNINFKKAHGEISANVSVNLANNYSELEGSTQGLRLSDFNFYKKLNLDYDGDLSVDFDGNGTKENFSSRFKTKIYNTFIENIPASPSNAIFYLNPDEIVFNANLLSGKIKLDSQINFKSRLMSTKSTVDTNDLRELLGIVAGHNMTDKTISGKVKAQLNSIFNLDTFVVKKFFLDIKQFNLKKGEVNLAIDPKHSMVEIDSAQVKSWDLRFKDGEDFFSSKAKNTSTGALVFDQSFSIKTSLLEFITSYVVKAAGVIKGSSQFVVDNKISLTSFDIKGFKNSLIIKNVPGTITDLQFSLSKQAEYFQINQLVGKYGEGEFKIGGNLRFDDLYPEVNLEYKIERSTIPLFKRSMLLASSSGTITGTDLPYKLNGKVTLLHGEFLDDPKDFTKDSKVTLEPFKKYLPQKSSIEKRGYLNLNISFETANQIVLRNNLAEVFAKGYGQLSGDILSPEINTRIEIIPSVSKFKFKGHDFNLSQGYVEIRDRGKIRNSDLKFTGISKINDFDVKLDISGSIENTTISLSSEPVLAQEDLVSLLTLGVTSDMSKNLEASERKSVTTVGIGSLLVDQLKINEDLNSSLGLNLSVLPEFKEDETSLVSGKSAVSDSGTSKLKSGTKIIIKKQINKSVDVSLSSTVGGSIEQTQEMNINLNLNKNFSLDGVYEVKPAEEVNSNTSNSVGADLKYRTSF